MGFIGLIGGHNFFYSSVHLDKFIVPSAISRSDSANANLAVNRSKVLSVLSLADAEAPSKAALIAKMSSAKEDDDGFLRR